MTDCRVRRRGSKRGQRIKSVDKAMKKISKEERECGDLQDPLQQLKVTCRCLTKRKRSMYCKNDTYTTNNMRDIAFTMDRRDLFKNAESVPRCQARALSRSVGFTLLHNSYRRKKPGPTRGPFSEGIDSLP